MKKKKEAQLRSSKKYLSDFEIIFLSRIAATSDYLEARRRFHHCCCCSSSSSEKISGVFSHTLSLSVSLSLVSLSLYDLQTKTVYLGEALEIVDIA